MNVNVDKEAQEVRIGTRNLQVIVHTDGTVVLLPTVDGHRLFVEPVQGDESGVRVRAVSVEHGLMGGS